MAAISRQRRRSCYQHVASLRLFARITTNSWQTIRFQPGRGSSVIGRTVRRRPQPFIFPMCWPIRNITYLEGPKQWRRSGPCSASRSCVKERRSGSSFWIARTVQPFTDKQIELVDDLRRPGRHRDRERAPVRRGAGAHARARAVGGRIARAWRGHPGGQLHARPANRARRDCRQGDAAFRHRGRRDLRV